jgi:hypothetical protein
MHPKTSRVTLLAIALLAASARADDHDWSIGLGIGQADIGTAQYGDGSASVALLEFGWQATDTLRVVGGYASHNNGGFTNCIGMGCGAPPIAVYNDSATLFLGAEAMLPLSGDWTGLARLTYRTIDPRPYVGSDTSAIALGVGAEYAFDPEWSVRLTVETYDADSADYLESTLGVRYRFDGAALATTVAGDGDASRWQLSIGVDSNEFTGYEIASQSLSGRTTGVHLGAALRVIGPLWLEVSYRELGRFESATFLIDPSTFPPTLYPTQFTQEGSAIGYGLRFEPALGAGFSGILRLGRYEGSVDQHFDAAGPYPDIDFPLDASASVYGIGVAYAIDARWSVELAFDDVDVEDIPYSYRFSTLPDSSLSLALRASF